MAKRGRKRQEKPLTLYDKARLCGFTDEQIATFASEQDLYDAVCELKPEFCETLSSGPLKVEPEKPKPPPPPEKTEFEIKMTEFQVDAISRDRLEERMLQSDLRRFGVDLRKYSRMIITRQLKPKSGNYITSVRLEK